MEFTILRIISLGAVDAVNPCALAVLSLMLISIISYKPEKKNNIIFAGFAFTISVFVMYLFYGVVLIRFFQVVQALTSIRLTLYKILGGIAIVLGILQLKDFFNYSPGTLGTEMPKFLRPKVKKVISGLTSPWGAFGIGAFVTLFLLPCTIGPYIVAAGSLSTAMEVISAIPYLLLYNLIFVLPMIGITIAVYIGATTVQDVSQWKDENIKYLHLISGVIIFLLGVAMLMGWL